MLAKKQFPKEIFLLDCNYQFQISSIYINDTNPLQFYECIPSDDQIFIHKRLDNIAINYNHAEIIKFLQSYKATTHNDFNDNSQIDWDDVSNNDKIRDKIIREISPVKSKKYEQYNDNEDFQLNTQAPSQDEIYESQFFDDDEIQDMKMQDIHQAENEVILSQEEEQEANIDSWFGSQIVPSSIISSLTQCQSSHSVTPSQSVVSPQVNVLSQVRSEILSQPLSQPLSQIKIFSHTERTQVFSISQDNQLFTIQQSQQLSKLSQSTQESLDSLQKSSSVQSQFSSQKLSQKSSNINELTSSQSTSITTFSTKSNITNSTGKSSKVKEYQIINTASNNNNIENDIFSNKLKRIIDENQSNVNQSCIGNILRKKIIVNGETKYLYGKDTNINVYNTLRQLEYEVFEKRNKNISYTNIKPFKLYSI